LIFLLFVSVVERFVLRSKLASRLTSRGLNYKTILLFVALHGVVEVLVVGQHFLFVTTWLTSFVSDLVCSRGIVGLSVHTPGVMGILSKFPQINSNNSERVLRILFVGHRWSSKRLTAVD
jgi:hypothetical protein